MSYAIVRNEKLTRNEAKGRYVHNERKTKGHTNKDINPERTHLNYYFKKNELSYIKEFDKLRKERDLKGQIKSNSIIMCEMIFTSDKEFFDNIGEQETKRYFEEISLDEIRSKVDNPDWWYATRAMCACVLVVLKHIKAKYIIPTNIAMVYGLVDDNNK